MHRLGEVLKSQRRPPPPAPMTPAAPKLTPLQATGYDPAEKADWEARLKAKIDAIEKPPSPYRIVQLTQHGTWRVEKWRILSHYPYNYVDMDRPRWRRYVAATPEGSRGGLYYGPTPDCCKDWKGHEPVALLSWEKFGRQDFDTFEAASHWLFATLNPIAQLVHYDEQGEPLQEAA